MFHQVLRDSFWGNLIYLGSGSKYLKYREESFPEFVQEIHMVEAKLNAEYISDAFSGCHYYEQTPPSNPSVTSYLSNNTPSSNDRDPSSTTTAGDSHILISWDGDNDPDNPVDELMKNMKTTRLMANLRLTCFAFGYGVGPMVFSPLSENARFGRTTIYLTTLILFFILQFPCALVTDIASLSVLRFFAGFFASPSLATGGASIGDVVSAPYMPMALAWWSVGAFSAPSIGPLIGAALISANGYHWPFWFVCHITNESRSVKDIVVSSIWRPLEIVMFEPVVLFMDIYSGFIYLIMYIWFEAFPIVFQEMNAFSTVGEGASSLCLTTGLLLSVCFHLPVVYCQTTRKFLNGETVNPEVYLPMCIFGSCFLPTGLIIFAWTATPSVHWIVPMIGAATFMFGAFIVYQTLFNYIGMSFPNCLASVYAGNGFCRSMMGGASPLFGRAMFTNLGSKNFPVAWGTTLLACITIALLLVPVCFYLNGPKLRARSKYAN
ncbi:hypothetical protein JCM33374_g1548 [Metschnikowia sp. JCM 33374]|nr:hypothetical protein JCM33374_g1548 [Metschnikowia sp. JCM 33374]